VQTKIHCSIFPRLEYWRNPEKSDRNGAVYCRKGFWGSFLHISGMLMRQNTITVGMCANGNIRWLVGSVRLRRLLPDLGRDWLPPVRQLNGINPNAFEMASI